MAAKLDEKAIDFLEEGIPELAEAAFKQARSQALASGHSILEYEGAILYEVFPDGTRRVFEKPVQNGEKRTAE